MSPLLITGAGGFLGESLCLEARSSWRVFGAFFSRRPQIPDVEWIKADLTLDRDIDRLFKDVRPKALIHSAALSDPNYCETHPKESFAANVKAVEIQAKRCAELKIPFIFMSTDLAFDGRHAPYRETDPPSPLSVYGRHKAEAERTVLKTHPGATVCRLPLMFGFSSIKTSFLQTMTRNLKNSVSFSLFTDEFRTPMSYFRTARAIIAVLENRLQGMIHIGGPERISRYEFGVLAAKIMGMDYGCIQPRLQQDVPMPAPRPADVSLNSSISWNLLGFEPPSLESQLCETLPGPASLTTQS